MPIEYQREEDPNILFHIEPHIVTVQDQSRANYLQLCFEAMKSQPGSIFVYTAKNQDALCALAIAHAPVREVYVWISNVWSRSDNPREIGDYILHRLKLWTVGMGRQILRGQTMRSSRAWFRRFSFKPHASIVQYKIPEDFFNV